MLVSHGCINDPFRRNAKPLPKFNWVKTKWQNCEKNQV